MMEREIEERASPAEEMVMVKKKKKNSKIDFFLKKIIINKENFMDRDSLTLLLY